MPFVNFQIRINGIWCHFDSIEPFNTQAIFSTLNLSFMRIFQYLRMNKRIKTKLTITVVMLKISRILKIKK